MRLTRHLQRARRVCLAALVCFAGLGACQAAVAAAPVRKPPHRIIPQQQLPHDPMDVTATIPSVPPPPPTQTDGVYPQFHLPVATRARMRACGLRWQGMKMAGEAGDKTWREFATQCLPARDAPTTSAN